MKPLLRAEDLVVIENVWYAEPMHYYLTPDRVRTAGVGAFKRRLRAAGETDIARIWLVVFGDAMSIERRIAALERSLRGYRPLDRVSALRCAAVLFERRPKLPTGAGPRSLR